MPFLKVKSSYNSKVIHFFEKNNDIFVQIRDITYSSFVLNVATCFLTKIDNPFIFNKRFKDQDMLKLLTNCIVDDATLDIVNNEWYLQLMNISRTEFIRMLEPLDISIQDVIKTDTQRA